MSIRVQTPQGIVEFPDGMSEQDMAAALAQLPKAAASHDPRSEFDARVEQAAGGASGLSADQPIRGRLREAGQFLKQNAPAIATMGLTAAVPELGLLTLPARAVVAGGGGFLGARVRGDDRETATREGAVQALTEGGGAIAAKALKGGARRLYGGLLKPKQGVKDSFGNAKEIADTLLEERVPISAGGVKKVTGKLGASRAAALDVVQQAEAAGTQGVTAKDVISEFDPVITELRKRVDIGQPNELAKVGTRGKAILKTAGGRGGDIRLTRAQQLKETAQDASSGAYRVMERGGQKQLSADDLLDTAVARGFKGGIERKVPAVASHNQRTQKLLGATRALEDAVERESNNNMLGGGRDWAALGAAGLGAAGGGPAGAAAAGAAMRLLSTPSTGSRIAIGANELARLPFAQLIRMAQLEQLKDEQE